MNKKRFLVILAAAVSMNLAASVSIPAVGHSSVVTVSAAAVKSSDSSLSSMSISPGSLNPAFSPSVHEYTATVDASVTSISVAATPNDSKAAIASVSGAKSIKPGQNTVQVVVGAEDGTGTTYTITVTCGSGAASDSDGAAAPVTDTQTPGEGPSEADGDAAADVSDGDGTAADAKEESPVSFDENGYLLYDGDAYIPSEMMPEGDYVSLSKYNKLYEQNQTQQSNYMRLVIALAVLLVVACIMILNLALKLRDCKQDANLGASGDDDAIKRMRRAKEQKAKEQGQTGERHKAQKPARKAEKAPERERETEPLLKTKKRAKRAEEEPVQGSQNIPPETTMIPDLKLPDEMKVAVQQPKAPAPAAPMQKPVHTDYVQQPVQPAQPQPSYGGQHVHQRAAAPQQHMQQRPLYQQPYQQAYQQPQQPVQPAQPQPSYGGQHVHQRAAAPQHVQQRPLYQQPAGQQPSPQHVKQQTGNMQSAASQPMRKKPSAPAAQRKPAQPTRPVKQTDDLEILDLNDL